MDNLKSGNYITVIGRYDKIKNTIINTYEKYGFYPLDTPIIELSEVLLAKAGGATEKRIYRFSRTGNITYI